MYNMTFFEKVNFEPSQAPVRTGGWNDSKQPKYFRTQFLKEKFYLFKISFLTMYNTIFDVLTMYCMFSLQIIFKRAGAMAGAVTGAMQPTVIKNQNLCH